MENTDNVMTEDKLINIIDNDNTMDMDTKKKWKISMRPMKMHAFDEDDEMMMLDAHEVDEEECYLLDEELQK
eukprot:6773232-Ditylum_brightwellii.AAC.1